jgi:hypothetical protein
LLLFEELAKDRMTRNPCSSPPPSIYFGGCAFGAAFYVGVYRAMQDSWGADFARDTELCGDSAGVVMVIGMALGHTPEFIGQTYCWTGQNARSGILWGGMEALTHYCLERMLDRASPRALQDVLSGKRKIRIGYSTFFAHHAWDMGPWSDRDELMRSIKRSFYIPCFCPPLKEPADASWAVDGAFVFCDEDKPHGSRTMYVGADPAADIPAHFSMQQLLFASIGKDYDEIVATGQKETWKWMGQRTETTIVRCTRRHRRRKHYCIQSMLWISRLVSSATGILFCVCRFCLLFFLVKSKNKIG